MSLRIIKQGMLTTIQDRGRFGYQDIGVPWGGAMDDYALRLANLLVGNNESEACVEFTMAGTQMYFEEDAVVAFTGGGARIFVNERPVPLWRSLYIKAYRLIVLQPDQGCRTYLSVAGGFKTEPVMGSQSTYIQGKLGGWLGRSLIANDLIPQSHQYTNQNKKIRNDFHCTEDVAIAHWSLSPLTYKFYSHPEVRVIRGQEWDWFEHDSQNEFFSEEFRISMQSNRMGYRLDGSPMKKSIKEDLISSAVTKGSIQVTPDNNMVLLMSDAQTTGGYPRIGQVAEVDLPICAQLKPGDPIRFREISIGESENLLMEREKEIEQLKDTIALRFS
ncbi:MAG: KipI antagonist [Bacteroidetes bacterium]|nr:MAG: KipI antagonist [Bacteroidota bacterium]